MSNKAVYKAAPRAVKATAKMVKQEGVKNWLIVLNHEMKCKGCKSINCGKLKDLLKHNKLEQCPPNCPPNCLKCTQCKNLVEAHAKQCIIKDCTLSGCKDHRRQLHMELLAHTANSCRGGECSSNNCTTMRKYLDHKKMCKKNSDCTKCSKINKLIKLHSEQCTKIVCGVPDCNAIRSGQQDQLDPSVTRYIYIPLLDATKLE